MTEVSSYLAKLQYCRVQIGGRGVTNELSGSIYDTARAELYIQNANYSPPAICAVFAPVTLAISYVVLRGE